MGFLAYNVLAGGVLTGKYLDSPAAPDQSSSAAAQKLFQAPRGRMDERGWGYTLYRCRSRIWRTRRCTPRPTPTRPATLIRYRSGPADEATRSYAKLANAAGMSLTELSLRWARERSAVISSPLGRSTLA